MKPKDMVILSSSGNCITVDPIIELLQKVFFNFSGTVTEASVCLLQVQVCVWSQFQKEYSELHVSSNSGFSGKKKKTFIH